MLNQHALIPLQENYKAIDFLNFIARETAIVLTRRF